MSEKDKKTEMGVIKIHNNVIAQISAIAAKEVKGVLGLEKDFIPNFFELVLGGSISNKGVRVESYENDVRVNISIVVEYGFNIPLMALKVQESIKSAIEQMTGLNPIEVNVDIKEVKTIKKNN